MPTQTNIPQVELSQQTPLTHEVPNQSHLDEQESLKPFNTNKEKLSEIKASLSKVLDATSQTKSHFSRAALFWGTIPLWQKIVGAVVLIVPLFLIGLAVLPGVLITLSLVLSLIYAVGSYLLDNHHELHTKDTEEARESINALASVLESVIVSLDTLREQLTTAISQLTQENSRLKELVTRLHEEIGLLAHENNELKKTQQKLTLTQRELEQTVSQLKLSTREQSELQYKNEIALKQTIEHYEQKIAELSESIDQLHELNTNLNDKVELEHTVIIGLQGMLDTTSKLIRATKERRELFLKKLEEFVTNKMDSLRDVADAERKLTVLADGFDTENQRYREINQRYHDILNQQEEQVQRLSKIEPKKNVQEPKPQIRYAPLLDGLGLNAKKTPALSQLTKDHEIVNNIGIAVH